MYALPCCEAVFGSKRYIHEYPNIHDEMTSVMSRCKLVRRFITRLVLHLLPTLIMECAPLLLHTIITNPVCNRPRMARGWWNKNWWLTVGRDIRRLIVSDSDKMVGIITDKDIFRTITNNQDLIPILLDDKLLVEHRTVYDQFSQYWFSDILRRS